eukprot:EG_transcript_41706
MASRAALQRAADRIFRRNYLFPPHQGRTGMQYLREAMEGPELTNWYPHFPDPHKLDDTGIYLTKEDVYHQQKLADRDAKGLTKPPKGMGWRAFKRAAKGKAAPAKRK